MRWMVLVVRPDKECVDDVAAMFKRAGVQPTCVAVDSRAAVVAALQREWDVVVFDPQTKIPIDVVYKHAPAAAVVTVKGDDDMADELARLVANRASLDD